MHVAIIGAGLGGLTLALGLHRHGIKCTLYDLREPTHMTVGGLMLSPNALRVLDELDLYDTISQHGFQFSSVEFADEYGNVKDAMVTGDKDRYGYKCIRILRRVLLDTVRTAVQEAGIQVLFGKRFTHVVEETEEQVTYAFSDGTTEQANLLIGADGVHSTVRESVCPGVKQSYIGSVTLLAIIKDPNLFEKVGYDKDAMTIYHGPQGVLMFMPQLPDGSETTVATSLVYPDTDRKGWQALSNDKQKLYDIFMQKKSDAKCETMRLSLERIEPQNIDIWPFYTMPSLPTYTSSLKRIIIMGDAAHAIPPSGGQGACQAIVDSWKLAETIQNINLDGVGSLKSQLAAWETESQQRASGARDFTLKLNNNRLPRVEREKLPRDQYWSSEDDPDLTWLLGSGVAQRRLDMVANGT